MLISISCASVPKTEKPLWADSLFINQVFPSSEYITALGYANKKEMAASVADGNLAAYFSKEISSYTKAVQTLSNTERNTENLSREIIVKSQIELFGIKHTECYFDSQSKNYIVCAYISRNEAWKILTQKLSVVQKAFKTACAFAAKEAEPFRKVLVMNRTVSLEKDFLNLYKMALIVYPKRCEVYTKTAERIAGEKQAVSELKRNLTVSVFLNGDFSTQLRPKFERVLSQNGFTVSQNGAYKLMAAVRAEQIQHSEMFFCTPQLEVIIEGKTGIVASFAAEAEKFSAYNAQTVERVTILHIEEIIDGKFVQECLQ